MMRAGRLKAFFACGLQNNQTGIVAFHVPDPSHPRRMSPFALIPIERRQRIDIRSGAAADHGWRRPPTALCDHSSWQVGNVVRLHSVERGGQRYARKQCEGNATRPPMPSASGCSAAPSTPPPAPRRLRPCARPSPPCGVTRYASVP